MTAVTVARGNDFQRLMLTDEAARTFRDWRNEVEPMQGQGGRRSGMGGWGAKMLGATPRLAALLHCAEHLAQAAQHPITADTMRRAVTLARYFIEHAIVLVAEAGIDPQIAAAAAVLGRLRELGVDTVAQAALTRHMQSKRLNAPQVEAALHRLEVLGWVQAAAVQPTGKNGATTKPNWHVNPVAFAGLRVVTATDPIAQREGTAELDTELDSSDTPLPTCTNCGQPFTPIGKSMQCIDCWTIERDSHAA